MLGFQFSPEGLSMVEKTIEKFVARADRFDEQEQEEPFGSPLLGLYVLRWERSLNRLRQDRLHSAMCGHSSESSSRPFP